jgi:hypothetical protein
VNTKLASVNSGPWNVVSWQILKVLTTFKKTTFVKNENKTNMEAGWKLQFIFCFMETTHEIKAVHNSETSVCL